MATSTRRRTKQRDAARSRQAITDAAEALFADRGYEATTMADIAAAAGLSTGLPAYFFASKEELYRSVLSRAFAETTVLIRSKPFGREDPGATIAEAMSAYIEFLAARPSFVRLVVRECLDGGRFLKGLPDHLSALSAALSGVGSERARSSLRDDIDLRHLIVSAISLCWFPLIATPLTEDLGLRPATKAFLRARQEQVSKLILHGALKGTRR